MLFVIGGSYQGKLEYVKERFGLTDAQIFTCTDGKDLDKDARCVYHYEQYVGYAVKNGLTPFTDFNSDQIVIMDDVNCGVVPVDPEIRAWREAVGRAGSVLSLRADEVVRVFCGLPCTLKSAAQKIYLIRHGKTQANIDFCYCGSTDLHLTEAGIEELKAKKEHIAYPDASKLRCCTSMLVRTQETFTTLFPGAEFTPSEAFNEMDFGDFEMRKYDGDLQMDPDYLIWSAGHNELNVCPHGESNFMMKRRVLEGFKEILAAGEDALIVAHGGSIAAIFEEYIPNSGLHYYEIQPKNGEGYCFEFRGGKFVKYTKLAEQS